MILCQLFTLIARNGSGIGWYRALGIGIGQGFWYRKQPYYFEYSTIDSNIIASLIFFLYASIAMIGCCYAYADHYGISYGRFRSRQKFR